MAFNPPPQISNMVNRKTFRNPTSQIVLYSLVIVLFSWFVLKPAITEWNLNKNALKVEKSKLEKIDSEKAALEELISELDAKQDDIDLLDEALPLNEELARLHILLNNFVSASGMQLAQVSIDMSKAGPQAGDKEELENRFKSARTIQTIPLNLSASGSIDQLRNLLQLIETNGRVLDVVKVEMVKGPDITSFQLQLKAYAYDNGNESK